MPFRVVYKIYSEVVLGIEIPLATEIGAGLTIYHGRGIVINSGSKLGESVVLRQNVLIGSRRTNSDCPVVGDFVEFGAASMALGEIEIGENCRIGAGAVVTKDVPAGSTMVGNPAYVAKPGRQDTPTIETKVSGNDD